MKLSEDRILTTHVGSLPRDRELSDMLIDNEAGQPVDKAALDKLAAENVLRCVQSQIKAGLDIVNDGEQPRISFMTYVAQRLEGFGGKSERDVFADDKKYPDFAEMFARRFVKMGKLFDAPAAVGEIRYTDLSPAVRECDMFDAALKPNAGKIVEPFMTAVSPGMISTTLTNKHYDSRESYLKALARELRKEYELIHQRGYLLQLDSPDLALDRHAYYQNKSLKEFQKGIEANVEAINQATAGIPRDKIRLHVCWGNYDGPHDSDVEMKDILPIIYQAKVGAVSLVFANPRHQHEFETLKELTLPKEMVLIPGVIDSTINFIEHPKVVCNRILQAVEAVGDRERVIAGVDCGFGTLAGYELVARSIVWRKFESLAEGARMASRELWGRA